MAQGRRALAFVLAAKMSAAGCLDIKEHNGQVLCVPYLEGHYFESVRDAPSVAFFFQTALQIAAATDQHLIAQDLLAHGARVDVRDLWGRSPLHVCAEKGHVLSLQVTHQLDANYYLTLYYLSQSHNLVILVETRFNILTLFH